MLIRYSLNQTTLNKLTKFQKRSSISKGLQLLYYQSPTFLFYPIKHSPLYNARIYIWFQRSGHKHSAVQQKEFLQVFLSSICYVETAGHP